MPNRRSTDLSIENMVEVHCPPDYDDSKTLGFTAHEPLPKKPRQPWNGQERRGARVSPNGHDAGKHGASVDGKQGLTDVIPASAGGLVAKLAALWGQV